MAEGRSREVWSHTSTVLAMIANVNRDPKKHGPYGAKDFNPYTKLDQAQQPTRKMPITVLRDVFIDHKTPTTAKGKI